MFRRSGKNPLENEGSSLYHEESQMASPYKFATKKDALGGQDPARLFDFPNAMPEERKPEAKWGQEKPMPLSHHFQGKKEDPETTLGEGVTFRGELSFERLLRIDGTFEGELISQGKVIVGPKGKVKANLNLREAVIEGRVEGNITVQERLELRGEASVHGDIVAKTLSMDEGVSLLGLVKVLPGEKVTPS